MIWFTADTHFGHAAIVSHCHRPFRSVEDMDEYIISRLNQCIKADDILYHLGDFAWTNRWREYRDLIVCKTIHLISGNHDTTNQLKRAQRDGIFDSISYYRRLKIGKNPSSPLYLRAILCHYPIQVWQAGFVHLHGHSHGCLLPEVAGRKDVGVDAQSFSPVSVGAIQEMEARPERDGCHV